MDFNEELDKSIDHLKYILSKKGLDINKINFQIFKELVSLIFYIDDIFDNNTKLQEVSKIKEEALEKLQNYPLTKLALDRHIDYRFKEKDLTVDNCTFSKYIEIGGVTVGSELLTYYLIDSYGIELNLRLTHLIKSENRRINTLLRLSNDLLDFKEDKERVIQESSQLKSRDYIKSSLILQILLHILLIRYRITLFFSNLVNRNILLSISSSIFEWSFKLMYIDKVSGRMGYVDVS
jgi:hypothetical protein